VAASGAAVETNDAHCVRAEEDEATDLVMGGDGYALRVLAALASGAVLCHCHLPPHGRRLLGRWLLAARCHVVARGLGRTPPHLRGEVK
jgi:hypothetical protein